MPKYDVILQEEFLSKRTLTLSVFAALAPSTVADLHGATGLSSYDFPTSGDDSKEVELELQADGTVAVLDSGDGQQRFHLQPGNLVIGDQIMGLPVVDRGRAAPAMFTVVSIK